PPSPRAICGDHSIPTAIEQACLRCLEKEPHQRFASAADLVEALGLRWDLTPSEDDRRMIAGCPRYWDGGDPSRVLDEILPDLGTLVAGYAAAVPPTDVRLVLTKVNELYHNAVPDVPWLDKLKPVATDRLSHVGFFYDLFVQSILHS